MPRRNSSSPSKPTTVPTLLPKPEGLNNHLLSAGLVRLPLDLPGALQQPLFRSAVPTTSNPQKLLLPKLPAGMRPPSRIIVINNDESGQSHIQVINTSRSGAGFDEEASRKRRMLTGQGNMARTLLPKPESLVIRPRKTAVVLTSSNPAHVPIAAASLSPVKSRPVGSAGTEEFPQHSRKRALRKITEDASDGFEVYDEDGGEHGQSALQPLPIIQVIFSHLFFSFSVCIQSS